MGYEELKIEGRNAVLEAFRSGKTIDKLFVLDGCQDGPVRTIVREAKKHDTIIHFVEKERLDQLSETKKHQGVIAVAAAYEYAEVDEHHTIEDTAIVLGECIYRALGSKRGIERYGYCLPMDDCLCRVALDFGGRAWLVWDAEFHREKIGEMPTEMFLHFFKSLSDAARMNLNIKAEGQNEHHKIEGIFKALARAIKMAVRRDIYHFEVPSSKGCI